VPVFPSHPTEDGGQKVLLKQLPLVPRKGHELCKLCLQQNNVIPIMCNSTNVRFGGIAEVVVNLTIKYLRLW